MDIGDERSLMNIFGDNHLLEDNGLVLFSVVVIVLAVVATLTTWTTAATRAG
jgi:hypothetical protein